MDSINKNQTEHNHEDLNGAAAVEKIKQIVEKAESCFFSTLVAVADSCGTRPMGVQQVDDEGNLWFLSSSDSHKNQEIAINPEVTLHFQGSAHSDFLVLKGRASVARDHNKIKELWKPIFKTWFTEGEDDPRISVVKVTPTEGYYWDTKHGFAVAGIKMAIGALTGKTLDDSIEGKVRV
ncbi:MAG TPA: pyridoxamine 5'-phosphate oxidase family protein [Cellvibrio sp.]|nr:pyridoxamine 5'-phosphate oxidase family protein [Cellvibrio sp.]